MDILILGNGFDLAHGLNTRYTDFLEYCQEKYSTTKTVGCVDNSGNFLFENIWAKHFINKKISGDKWIDLEKEIYNVIIELSKLPYFKNNISLDKYANIVFRVRKYDYDFCFDKIKYYFNHPESVFEGNCYNVNIKDFIDFLYNQLRDFVKEFENYLMNKVMPTLKDSYKYKLPINEKCVSLLNFNYTDTCERLYKINFNHNDWGVKTKAVYVHGKICDENSSKLILGTKSFDNNQIPVEFNIFKKHHQRHRYGTIESYQELLNELKYSRRLYTPVFHIVGHSLDEADHNILRHILRAKEKSIINIYYHDEEALARMQTNIDLIIGEEEVMSKVRFIDQSKILVS